MTAQCMKGRLAPREARRRNREQANDMGQFEMRPKDPKEICGYLNDAKQSEPVEVMHPGVVYVSLATMKIITKYAPEFEGSAVVYRRLESKS